MFKMIFIFIAIAFFAVSAGCVNTKSEQKSHDGMKMGKSAENIKLVKCPVTGTMIDPAKAYSKTVYKGKTYYFCCAGCPEEFKKNPGKYAK